MVILNVTLPIDFVTQAKGQGMRHRKFGRCPEFGAMT
ncbi:hypothetical protein D046_3955, partial [Vibrio parahaemolyticus V-223/04]